MQLHKKTLLAALGAVLISAAPAAAHAEVVYFLVGTHHIYKIGPDQYALVSQREAIEQKYADDIAAAKATYDQHIAGGADPAAESDEFNGYLAQLSDQRDADLGALYANADDIAISHPELKIEGEGPYQVMGVNFHWRGPAMVFDNYTVYAPWPGYVVVGAPYGWAYGVAYSPFQLHSVYLGWHDTYFVASQPAFFGFVGIGGAINLNIAVGLGGHGYAIGGRPLGDFHTFRMDHPGWHPTPGRYPVGNAGANRPGYGGTRPGGYSRPGGYTRPAGSTTRPGGYGSTPRPGGYGTSGTTPRPGGTTNPRPGGYGTSGTTPRPGGYGASGTTSRPGYGNSGTAPRTVGSTVGNSHPSGNSLGSTIGNPKSATSHGPAPTPPKPPTPPKKKN